MATRDYTRATLSKARRIVVKIGTSSITDTGSRLDPEKVGKFVSDVMNLRARGKEVIIVSSGAIGAGMGRLNLDRRPKDISSLQAAAAVGQGILMQVYSRYFNEYQQAVAQILLTAEDFKDQRRYRNFKNTLATLMKWGVVPIVNENDSVALEEIRVGDNDLLSAHVAISAGADLLVILSDVEGLYRDYSRKGRARELISVVESVDEVKQHAEKSSRGGGMVTKIKAAAIATEEGIAAVVAKSGESKVLERILEGEEVGTLFLPGDKR